MSLFLLHIDIRVTSYIDCPPAWFPGPCMSQVQKLVTSLSANRLAKKETCCCWRYIPQSVRVGAWATPLLGQDVHISIRYFTCTSTNFHDTFTDMQSSIHHCCLTVREYWLLGPFHSCDQTPTVCFHLPCFYHKHQPNLSSSTLTVRMNGRVGSVIHRACICATALFQSWKVASTASVQSHVAPFWIIWYKGYRSVAKCSMNTHQKPSKPTYACNWSTVVGLGLCLITASGITIVLRDHIRIW